MDFDATSFAVGAGSAVLVGGLLAFAWWRLGGRPRVIDAVARAAGNNVANVVIPGVGPAGRFFGDIVENTARESLAEVLP